MRRHFVFGFPRALLSLCQEKSSGVEIDSARKARKYGSVVFFWGGRGVGGGGREHRFPPMWSGFDFETRRRK